MAAKHEFTEEECRRWVINPEINPYTGRGITAGKDVYKKIKKTCEKFGIILSEPKSVSPIPASTLSTQLSKELPISLPRIPEESSGLPISLPRIPEIGPLDLPISLPRIPEIGPSDLPISLPQIPEIPQIPSIAGPSGYPSFIPIENVPVAPAVPAAPVISLPSLPSFQPSIQPTEVPKIQKPPPLIPILSRYPKFDEIPQAKIPQDEKMPVPLSSYHPLEIHSSTEIPLVVTDNPNEYTVQRKPIYRIFYPLTYNKEIYAILPSFEIPTLDSVNSFYQELASTQEKDFIKESYQRNKINDDLNFIRDLVLDDPDTVDHNLLPYSVIYDYLAKKNITISSSLIGSARREEVKKLFQENFKLSEYNILRHEKNKNYYRIEILGNLKPNKINIDGQNQIFIELSESDEKQK